MKSLMAATISLLVVALIGCGKSPISASFDAAPVVASQIETLPGFWESAQRRLDADYGVSTYHIPASSFRFYSHPGSFDCGGVSANGCYRHGEIHYNVTMPQVLEHEAMHAMLHMTRDARWKCVGHTC
jgi:hypothetical protein